MGGEISTFKTHYLLKSLSHSKYLIVFIKTFDTIINRQKCSRRDWDMTRNYAGGEKNIGDNEMELQWCMHYLVD